MDEMKDPAERFIWFAFLLLAGDSPYEGKIALTEDMGYSDEQLGSMLKCDPILIKRAKKKMVKFDKIKILNNNIIQIVNWSKYQSEYQRQKIYRGDKKEDVYAESYKRKLHRKVTTKGYEQEREGEREGDKDIDRDLREDEYILNLLSKVKDYPFNKKRDREFIKGLIVDFPDLDALEEIKKKCAWWLSKPLLKKSNPHLQLRNWFLKAREFLKEGDKSRDVGKSYTKEPEFLPMELLNQIYRIIDSKGGDKGKFYIRAKSAFPIIRTQWDLSDKTPETFIRLVEGT